MTNAFEQWADVAKPAPVRRKEQANEKRKATNSAKKRLDDMEEMTRLYRAWRRENLEELLEGPYGKDVKGLISFMRTMTLSSAPALVNVVQQAHWLKSAPRDTKYRVLSVVARGIASLREREGMAPFDDGMPGDEPTAFETIKTIIGAGA